MRILQVIHDFIDTTLAGSELYTYYLCKELMKRHEVAVFYYKYKKSLDGHPILEQRSYEGTKTFTVSMPTPALYHWSIVHYQDKQVDKLFRDVLISFKPEIVHFQHLLFSSMGFPNITKILAIPTVHTLHDFWLMCPRIRLINHKLKRCDEINRLKCFICCLRPYSRKNLLKRLVMESPYCAQSLYHLFYKREKAVRRVFKNIDLFISPSKFLRSKFIAYGLLQEKIIYCDNGMNYNVLKNYHNRKRPTNHMIFAYIGSHQVEKGVPLLIEAFNGISDTQLRIYGSGGEKQYQGLIKNPNIHLMGRVEDDQKAEAFSEIDVLIVPSLWFENSPLTIHEAFMFGVPVITSNIGGMAELVEDGRTGLHFEVGNAEDLRRKIQFCIDSPAEVERMAQNIPKVKSIQENVQELEEIYSNLISGY